LDKEKQILRNKTAAQLEKEELLTSKSKEFEDRMGTDSSFFLDMILTSKDLLMYI
jgi:hypothetical protein